MKVHEAIAKAFLDNGVTTMFGVVGDANLFIVQSFVDLEGEYFSTTHEAVATSMADGFSRVSGRLGCVTVTHGPGLMNAINALREAVRNRTPMVVLCGDTPSESLGHVQDVDQRALLLATEVGIEQVRSPRTAVKDVARVIQRAWAEQRPVALNVPLNFEFEEIDYVGVPTYLQDPVAAPPDVGALDRAMGVVASSRRPIVLVGRGALAPDARAQIRRLADLLGAPVATTLLAKGIFGSVPFDVGISGTFATPTGLDVLQAADCVVVFGAGLNNFTTADGSLLRDKAVVHCDSTASRIGQWVSPTAALVGDAATVAAAMCACLEDADIPPSGFRAEAERLMSAAANEAAPPDMSTSETIDIRTFVRWLDEVLPADRSLVFDAGRFIVESARKLRADPQHRIFGGFTSGTIGQGMASALGVAVGRPDAVVAAVVGDGGFMLGGLNAFSDAVRHRLDNVITVVLNDGGYGAEYIQLAARGFGPETSLLCWPDLAPIADALGGRGVTVRNVEDLAAAAAAIAGRTGPILLDVKLDPAFVPDKHEPDAVFSR